MPEKLSVLTDDVNDFFLVLIPISPFLLFLQVIMRDHILLVMVDGTTLASVKLDSVNDLCDPVHRYHLLDILLFAET